MRISEAAKQTGLSVSNIRFYEKKGLLSPVREEESKYRDYSGEDIVQLKKIILFRKMNIPVETIYLIQKGEISPVSVLKRQQEELLEQKKMLQGSIDLCEKILENENLQDLDVDYYLNYVKEEEEKGKRFGKVEELLEDFAEFSGLSPSQAGLGFYLVDHKVRKGVFLAVLALIILTPVSMILESIMENGWTITFRLVFWIVWLAVLLTVFVNFRSRKKGEE